MRPSLAAAFALAFAAACSQPREGAGDDWANPGGDQGKTHFSRLADINTENVTRLGFAWELRLGTNRGQEATPVVIDGVMVTSGNLGRVYALDAATGVELWRFEPDVDMQANRYACCDQVNRGVAVKGRRVFVGALDGVLYALDLRTGAVLWRADTVADPTRGVTITGAPEVAGDVVIIGNGGAEFDVRGYVTAYDVRTGAQRWRFFTVPRDPALGPQENPDLEPALATWDPQSRWDVGGGGTVWDAINYDPEFEAVYIGVGNGDPHHAGRRSPAGGDNLFLSSIVALDPRTGRVKWHYQETPQDSWDYTAAQPMILTRMDIGGERVPVILHAPKNGFLYVIDRRDGRVLRASPLVRQNWTDGVDLRTGRPRLDPRADYTEGPRIVFPSALGARNWQPGAYSPETGLFYGAVLDMGMLMALPEEARAYRPRALNNGVEIVLGPFIEAALAAAPPATREALEPSPELAHIRAQAFSQELRAIEPLTGRTVWSIPLSDFTDRGGVLATAGGLIFQGDLAGRFNAYDARTGAHLHSIETGATIIAAPMTYRAGGTQYVAVMTGWGGGLWSFTPRGAAAYTRSNEGRIIAFKLDGGATPLPELLPPIASPPPPPQQRPGTNPARLAYGAALFAENCARCHSNSDRSLAPDLRRMQPAVHAIFDDIVLRGQYLPAGMPRFDDLLSAEDAGAIQSYLIDQQRRLHAGE